MPRERKPLKYPSLFDIKGNKKKSPKPPNMVLRSCIYSQVSLLITLYRELSEYYIGTESLPIHPDEIMYGDIYGVEIRKIKSQYSVPIMETMEDVDVGGYLIDLYESVANQVIEKYQQLDDPYTVKRTN